MTVLKHALLVYLLIKFLHKTWRDYEICFFYKLNKATVSTSTFEMITQSIGEVTENKLADILKVLCHFS